MATPVTAPTPDVNARASQEIAAAKTGHEPLKPFRYMATFIGGSLKDGLNDMAHYGRKGLWVGLGLGIICAIAMTSLPFAVGGALIGFGGGALGGAGYGVLTGGFKAVGRVHRGEVYAEDLIQRKQVQARVPTSRADYRAAYADQRRRDGIITQQALERRDEVREDFNESRGNNYWQDRVSSGQNADYGRGF